MIIALAIGAVFALVTWRIGLLAAAFYASIPVCILLVLVSIRRLVLFCATLVFGPPDAPLGFGRLPKVTVFIPAHNEQAVLGDCLESLAGVEYPELLLEVVVIDDASTDETAQIAQQFIGRVPGLKVMHRSAQMGGRGKPAALIAALEEFSDQQVCYFLDADTTVEKDVLLRAAGWLSDPQVGAVTGRLEPKNPTDSPAAYYTAVEAWTHQLGTLWPASNANLTCAVLGSNWAIGRNLLDRYGLGAGELLEDTDLSVALAAGGHRIVFDERMVAHYEVPSTLGEYFRQHVGWARGFARIGARRSRQIIAGAGNVFVKIDRLIYSWGYFDRPLLVLFVAMVLANFYRPMFVAPLWLLAVVVTLPVLQALAGLSKAGRPLGEHWRLIFVPPMFVVDVAAALTAFGALLFSRPQRWYKTGRRNDAKPGTYMKPNERDDG